MMTWIKIWAIALHIAWVGAIIGIIWVAFTIDWDEAGRDLGSFAGSIVRGYSEQVEP